MRAMANINSRGTPSTFWAYVRITRPWNVLIIAAAMALVFQAWIAPTLAGIAENYDGLVSFMETFEITNFVLSVCVMCLLAAGGNTINDYFDVTEDAVNKPDRLIVGRLISRRKTMAYHYVLNGLASLMSVWLSFRLSSAVPLIWCAFIGTLLSGYSPWFKRRFLRGNLIISFAVGQLPLWTLIGVLPLSHWSSMLGTLNGFGLLTYAALSAYLTFLREITKDLQDVAGDREAGYDTLAVRWGSNRTIHLLQILHFSGWALLGISSWAALKWFDATWTPLLFLLPFLGAHLQLTRGLIHSVSAYQKLTLAGGLGFLAFMVG